MLLSWSNSDALNKIYLTHWNFAVAKIHDHIHCGRWMKHPVHLWVMLKWSAKASPMQQPNWLVHRYTKTMHNMNAICNQILKERLF